MFTARKEVGNKVNVYHEMCVRCDLNKSQGGLLKISGGCKTGPIKVPVYRGCQHPCMGVPGGDPPARFAYASYWNAFLLM